MSDLYAAFSAELQAEFKDYGYVWNKAKERSCDWILQRLPAGTGVDVGGTAYLVKKAHERADVRMTYFDYFPPKDKAIVEHVAADMAAFGDHFTPRSLDFITTRHTLEHALNPLFQLWQYNRALKDGGKLIVVVPQHSRKWVWFYSHFNCLPRENWLMLFHRTGFKVLESDAGTWKADDPEFVEYRFVLEVEQRGFRLNTRYSTF